MPEGVEEPLELDVEQRPAADEEFEPAAEVLPDLAEEDLVVEANERLLQRLGAPAPVPALGVVVDRRSSGPCGTGPRPSGPCPRTPFSMFLRKFLARAGTLRRMCGRISLMFRGMLRSVSMAVRPGWVGGDARPRSHQRVDGAGVGEGVVPRQDDQADPVLGAVDQAERLLAVGRVVAVGQDDALGIGRRPRRVADVGGSLSWTDSQRVFERGSGRGRQEASPDRRTSAAEISSPRRL